MSRRTVALRPAIDLTPRQRDEARRLRRAGQEPPFIAEAIGASVEEVEKALLQMRMPRPETTRGTLNVTLAAHALVQKERKGDEPLWQTMDRLLDELLRHRAAEAVRARRRQGEEGTLPLFPEGRAEAGPEA